MILTRILQLTKSAAKKKALATDWRILVRLFLTCNLFYLNKTLFEFYFAIFNKSCINYMQNNILMLTRIITCQRVRVNIVLHLLRKLSFL